MTSLDVAVRPATPEDIDPVATLLGIVFHHTQDPEVWAVERPLHDPARGLVAVDGETIVGAASSFQSPLVRQVAYPSTVPDRSSCTTARRSAAPSRSDATSVSR